MYALKPFDFSFVRQALFSICHASFFRQTAPLSSSINETAASRKWIMTFQMVKIRTASEVLQI